MSPVLTETYQVNAVEAAISHFLNGEEKKRFYPKIGDDVEVRGLYFEINGDAGFRSAGPMDQGMATLLSGYLDSISNRE